jgi:competence protein ComEC
VLILLCWLAFHWRARLRVAGPCILLAAAVSIGLGNALSRDVVHIDLVGSANAPAVVVTQNDTAVVLFRGGASAQNAVENQLARRGVQTVELVADLRTNPKTACTLEAERTLPAAEMAVNTAQKLRCTPALVEMLRTRNGCFVRLTVGNRQFAVVNGTVELAKQVTVQWLMASPAKPDAVQYKNVLALRSYDWMDNRKELAASISLRRHGGLKTE